MLVDWDCASVVWRSDWVVQCDGGLCRTGLVVARTEACRAEYECATDAPGLITSWNVAAGLIVEGGYLDVLI